MSQEKRGTLHALGWRLMWLLPSVMIGTIAGLAASMRFWWKGYSCREAGYGMGPDEARLNYSIALWSRPVIVVRDGVRPYPTPLSYPALAAEWALMLAQSDLEVRRLKGQEATPPDQ